MSNALDGGDLAARMARGHAAGCASCQAFGRSLGALDGELSRTAHTATRPLPRVRMERRQRRPMLVAGSLAVAAAAVVALAVSTADRPAAPAPAVPPIAINEPRGEPRGEAPGNSFDESLGRVRVVADRFSRALVKTPLDTELDALIQDGRRGFDALIDTAGLQ
jgi:hypothetical protein